MTEIKVFDLFINQSVEKFRVCLEFKMNHANWEAEIEVTRTEEENYTNNEFNLINEELLPELTEADKQELYETAVQYMIDKRKAGEI